MTRGSTWLERMPFAKMHSFQAVMKTKVDVATRPTRAFEDADVEAKVAIVTLLAVVSVAEARRRLAASEASIRWAVDR